MEYTSPPFALPSNYFYADPTSQNWILQEIIIKADEDASPLAKQYTIRPQSDATKAADTTTVPVHISCHDPSFHTRSSQLNFITHTSVPSSGPSQPQVIDESHRAGHFEPLPSGAGSSDEEDEQDRTTDAVSKPREGYEAPTSSQAAHLLLNIDSASPSGLRVDFKLGTKIDRAVRNSTTSQSRPNSTSQRASFTSLGSLGPTPRSQAGSPQPVPRGPRSPSVHSRGWSLSAAEVQGLRAPSDPASPFPSPVPSPSFANRVSLPEEIQEIGLLFITCSQAEHLRDFVHDLTAQAQHNSEGPTSTHTDGQDSADFATAAAKNVIDRHAGRMTCKAVDLNARHAEATVPSNTVSEHVLFTTQIKPFSSARHTSPTGQSIICAFVELRHADKSAGVVLAWQFWLSDRPASTPAGSHGHLKRASQHAQTSSLSRDESSLVGFPRSESPPFTTEASGRHARPSRNRSASFAMPAPLLACLDRTELALEEIESDSPMVRAAFSNLDKRTATLKRACKALLKCVAEVKSNMAALQASESGLDDCFSNLAAALTPNGFEEVAKRSIAQERTRSAKMRDEQLRCLHEFVELPIKALIDLCRRAQESHTAFEAESKAFYAATQKWLNKSGAVQESPQLSSAQSHQSTNDKGHEKQRHRELRFLLARLELFDAFTRLHGGQAELDMATSALSSYSRLNEVAVNLWTSEGSSARIAANGVTESFIPSLQAERQRVSSIRFACAQRIANVQAHLAASENLLSKSKSQEEGNHNPKSGVRMSQDLPMSPIPQKENNPIRSPRVGHETDSAASSTMDPKLFPMLPVAPTTSPQSKKPRFRNILGSMAGPSELEPVPSPVSSYGLHPGHGVSQASLEEQSSAPIPESPQRQRNFRHFKQLAGRLQNSQVTAAALKARNKWRSGSTAPNAVHVPTDFPEISWPDSDGGDGLVEILNTTTGLASAAGSPGGRRPYQSTEASPRLSMGAGQRDASPQLFRAPSGKRSQSASSDSPILNGLAVRSPYGPLSGTDHGSSPHRSTSLSGAGINGGSGVGLGLVNRMRPEFTAIRTRSRVTSLGSGRDALNRSSGISEHRLQQQSSLGGSSQLAPVLTLPSDLQESDIQMDADAAELEDFHKASESPDQTLTAVPPESSAGSSSQPSTTSPGRKKEGILWVMSKPISGPAGTDAPRGVNRSYHWREAWVVLSGSGHLSEYSEWRDGSKMLSPSSPVIDLRFATVREARGVDRRFTFEVVTRDHRRFFQAASDEGLRAWIGAISKAIESLINGTSSVRQVEKVAARKHMPFSPALDGNVPEEHHGGEMDGSDVLVEADEWSGDGNRRPRDVFDDLSGGGHGSSNHANSSPSVGSYRPWSQSLTDLGTFTSGISGMSPIKLFQRSSGNGSSGTDPIGPSSPTVGDALSKRSSRQGGKTTSQGQLGIGKENARHSGQSSETHNRDSNVSSSMYTAQSEASAPSQTEERNGSAVAVPGHGTSGTATGSGGISNKTPVSGYVGRFNANEREHNAVHEGRPTHLERPGRGGTSTSGNGWSLSGAGSEQDFELDQRIEAMVNSHYGSTSDLMNLASTAPASPMPGEAMVSPSLASQARLPNATDSGVAKPSRSPRFASEVGQKETTPSVAHNHQRSASIGTTADSMNGLRKGSNAMSRTKTTTAISDKYTRAAEIMGIASRAGNAKCADCHDANPRWASWSLNGVPRCIFICIRCSGMHRSLGVHISKVRSVDLDDWNDDQIRAAREWGNERVNRIYEGRGIGRGERPRPGHFQGKDFWIKKYVDCIWKVEEDAVAKTTSVSQASQRQHEHDTHGDSISANESSRPATSPTTTSSHAAPIPPTPAQAQA